MYYCFVFCIPTSSVCTDSSFMHIQYNFIYFFFVYIQTHSHRFIIVIFVNNNPFFYVTLFIYLVVTRFFSCSVFVILFLEIMKSCGIFAQLIQSLNLMQLVQDSQCGYRIQPHGLPHQYTMNDLMRESATRLVVLLH